MALRLADARTAAANPTPVETARSLTDRARAALRADDLDAFCALAAETATIAHPHRAYVTRRTLVELGLAAADGAAPQPAALRLVATADVALTALEAAPAEPVLLNLAGVALYELGALRGARDLFRAAGRLDPELPHVERNLAEVARRRRHGVTVAVPTVAGALPELERRARRVSELARPATAPTISLCMIVRDEEEVLGRCLAAARPAVDEIVVVDTGSTDRTREIARNHGAVVLEHAWSDSFAEARNVSLDAATSDWVLFLDADEVLVAEDVERLRALVRRSWREGFLVTITNYVGGETDGTALTFDALRLFRSRPEHRFEGRLHEQIATSLPSDAPERLQAGGVRVEHYGYLSRVREAKDKFRRNLELLERQARETAPSSFLSFNLGTEHLGADDVAAAVTHFERAQELLRTEGDERRPSFAPLLFARHVRCLRELGRGEEAHDLAERGLRLFPGFTDLVFEQAQLARRAGDLEAAEALWRRCLVMGDAPSAYAPVLGAGSFLAACALAHVRLARGDGAEAEAVLLDALAAHPRFLGTVAVLGQAMLARGAAPAELVAVVAERVGALTPSVRFVLATALYEAGHAEAAESQLRALLDDDPKADPARLALAEALLSQRRYTEAAETAEAVADGAGCAPQAAVTEAFARILAADADGAARAVARGERVGTAPADRALLAAWTGASRGEALPATLPGTAGRLLMTVLEALLRVEEIDAFAMLVPALERLEGVSPRARREALAELYLRRGFLESAAEEWIAACEEDGPDGPALAGLARVAAARGHDEDARLFALEAEALGG